LEKGLKKHDMTVKVGDEVLYGKIFWYQLKLEGKDYLIERR
jgi:chaperonin GroES